MGKIGIWWDDGQRLVALTHPASENATRISGRIDSNLAHVDEWPSVANRLGRSAREEYFVVPRGRVVLDARTGRGIVFHGNGTSRDRLALIAERFDLAEWQAELDAHYSVGAEIDRLFDEDD
ncbi:hypothetical protein [Candidatus Laterigemmans baculatus]|uniref:hypothetical protein n=1 Tax=Candidatus Laterigemmans baculatus TaxID=2770505 RepID=UPI0013D9C394|nr:hypothetical protein [Candidatus Laterigemmans baculatus]